MERSLRSPRIANSSIRVKSFLSLRYINRIYRNDIWTERERQRLRAGGSGRTDSAAPVALPGPGLPAESEPRFGRIADQVTAAGDRLDGRPLGRGNRLR